MAARSCAFCTNAANSPEHIFDDWLNRESGRTVRRDYVFEEAGGDDVVRRTHAARLIGVTRKVVCKACNHGWMSDLSNHVRQRFDRAVHKCSSLTLEDLDAVTLTAYAFMKAVVVDHALDRKPLFEPSVRHRFRADFSLPDGLQLWAAAHAGPFAVHAWHRTIELKGAQYGGFNFYIFTYRLGHLLLQLTCPRWRKTTRRSLPWPALNQSDDWTGTAIELWPFAASVDWPPTYQIEGKALEQFRDRFHQLKAQA